MKTVYSLLIWLVVSSVLSGCATVKVDELRHEATSIDPSKDTIVILGRHHSPEYETEPSLISCVGNKVRNKISGLNIIEAQTFTDSLYPWFEPRTAPLTVEKFQQVLDQPLVADAISEQNIKYIVWIEGATEKISGAGSLTCTVAPGLAGCFGFGVWEDESKYEASIWDYQQTKDVGSISTDAKGTSYMPAVVVPVPLLARVQANACDNMGKQIATFIQPDTSE